MTTLNVSIPEQLKRKLQASAKRKGFTSTSDYVRAIFESTVARESLDVEAILVKRLAQSESVSMDASDWKKIRAAVRSRVSRVR